MSPAPTVIARGSDFVGVADDESESTITLTWRVYVRFDDGREASDYLEIPHESGARWGGLAERYTAKEIEDFTARLNAEFPERIKDFQDRLVDREERRQSLSDLPPTFEVPDALPLPEGCAEHTKGRCCCKRIHPEHEPYKFICEETKICWCGYKHCYQGH